MAMTPDERRAIIGCVFASACILFAPGEFRAGTFLMLAASALTVRHVVLTRRELKDNPAPPGAKAALAPPAVAPSADRVVDEPSKQADSS